MKTIYILFFYFLFCFSGFAQKYDYKWVLGYNYTSPLPKDSLYQPYCMTFNAIESTVNIKLANYCNIEMTTGTTISDKTGKKLLFLVNGNHIQSASGKKMENGDDLIEGSTYADESEGIAPSYIYHGSIVLPDNDHPNLFYFICTYPIDDPDYEWASSSLRIAKIDMDANNGEGKVIYKNKILSNIYSNVRLNAVQHANGSDWWIILKNPGETEITELLLRKDSIIQQHAFDVKIDYPKSFETMHDSSGCAPVAISPDGNYLADIWGFNTVRVFNFDRCSGQIIMKDTFHFKVDSFFLEDGKYLTWQEDVIFSPNCRYLYTGGWGGLCQLDLKADNISSSRTYISGFVHDFGSNNVSSGYWDVCLGQIAPNGKIYYMADWNNLAINSPNKKGAYADFCTLPECKVINIQSEFGNYYPNYRLGRLIGSSCDTIISGTKSINSEKIEMKIFPSPSSGLVNIEITLPSYDSKNIPILEIHDISGKLIYEHTYPPYSYIYTIEAGTLKAGNYVASLKINNQIVETATFNINTK